MSEKKVHVQCRLEHEGKTTTRWLPAKFAREGSSIVISEDGINRESWTVVEVYNSMPSDYVNDRSQDYKRTRKASDV